MNRIYRLVWCRSLGALVVASELASSKRRSGGSHRSPTSRFSLLLPATILTAIGLSHMSAAHAQSVGDTRLADLQSLVDKYDDSHPAAQAAAHAQIANSSLSVDGATGSPAQVLTPREYRAAAVALHAVRKMAVTERSIALGAGAHSQIIKASPVDAKLHAPAAMALMPSAVRVSTQASVATPGKAGTSGLQPDMASDRRLVHATKVKQATATTHSDVINDEDAARDEDSTSASSLLPQAVSLATNVNVPTTFSSMPQDIFPTGSSFTPMAPSIAEAVPVVPAPGPTPTGLIVGNGGVVGTVTQLLGPTANSLFNNTNGYVSNGSLQVSNANFTQGYSTLNALGLPLLNLTPVGTLLTSTSGAVVGETGINSHLTLLGGVTSGNYIENINNGAAGGVLGIVLPNGAPAWASTCLNVLGLVTESCWGVNAAQDNQVLVGDGASANGSEEVVIGTNASHTLPTVQACTAFPGASPNDPTNPCGVPTADYEARLGHSVVIGDSASGTADAQTILGANATSSAANSVALGYASIADRGAQTNYTAYGLTALQNSAGEVSIGSPGQERQITNVAAGSALTDAANVAQLEGVASVADNSVQYDDASKTVVTLAGPPSTDGGVTGGTKITNLQQGGLSATSTDAVNGAQLYATNSSISNIYDTGTKYFHANSTGPDSNASGANSIAIGQQSVAMGISSIAMGNGATASSDNSVAIGNGAMAQNGDAVSIGSGNTANGNGAVAMGDPNTATGQGAVALGYENQAIGQGAIALGSTSVANGASAIALGDTASATAVNALAFGAGSSASMANSIALGAGSSTLVGALSNYTAYGLTAPQTSLGEVNVGDRQITGVAAGSALTDAVNVAQLEGVGSIANNSVQYDDASKTVVTLAGPGSTDGGVTGGTTITNLHQGDLSATSTDAVNGAQLYATNSSISNIYDTGTKYFHANSTGVDSTATGADSVAIGTGAVASNADDVALGANSVTAAPHTGDMAFFGGTAAGTALSVVSIGAPGQERQIQNVAPGVVATTSTDAINGSQLYSVVTGVTNLGTSVATSLGGTSTYDATTGTVTTGLSYGGSNYNSVQNVINALTGGGTSQGIKYFHANSILADADASGTDSVAVGPVASASGDSSVAMGNGANASGDDAMAFGSSATASDAGAMAFGNAASATAANSLAFGAGASASMANSIALGAGSSTLVGALSNYTAYGLTALQTSLGEVNVGDRQITGVAAGSALTDAVNVAQLEGVGNQVQAVDKLAVKYDADSSGNATNEITLVGDGTGAEVSITNLAAGSETATSTDAVNGSQLWHWTQDTSNIYSNYSLYNDINNLSNGSGGVKYFNVNSTLANSSAGGSNSIAIGPVAAASGNNSVAVGNGATATGDNSVAIGAGSVADRDNTVSVGSAGNDRQITNVAAGTQGTDAVNVNQLTASVTASTAGTVRYDTNTGGSIDYNSVTLGNGDGNTSIHNVAAGVANTDAVNVGQLNSGVQQAVNWANAYTDQQVQQLANHAYAGVAAAIAMAGLPQAYEPGKSMAAVSAGSFRGESSMAVGVSTISEGGRWVYKLTGSIDTRGDSGVSIGAGMQW